MGKELKRVLIMAGGTGGHVFPGLALANFFRDQQVEVHWLGTSQGLEARLVPEANFPLHLIHITGVRGKGAKAVFTAPIKIGLAVRQAMQILRQVNPDVVIGMGGFASGPGGIASVLLRKPLIIHEQNAIAGLTNRLLARVATRILTGFPHVFPAQKKVIYVGNPVRAEIAQVLPPARRLATERQPMRLLVLGGSLGAQGLNDIVPHALSQISPNERPEIWHQTGEKHLAAAKIAYESKQLVANLQPFISDMANAYAWADMVLCRAGALTIAELCTVGLGAVLVPFPYAVDDHQTANAKFMVQNNAAFCIQQAELTAVQLADIMREFANGPGRRLAMAQAAYQLRKDNVTEKVFEICMEVCR